jgi:hypothetical protein
MCTSCRKSGLCGNSSTYLSNYKKQATTLYNTTTNILEKEEIMSLIADIGSLIGNLPNQCPTEAELNLIKEYLSSEYLKRIR